MAELREIESIVDEAEKAEAAGDHAAAERALRRVLRLQEAGLGLSHPDVANTLNDLAVVCNRLGRPDEAEFLYRRALGIARRTLEPDHPYIAVSLENLSNLYRAQGKPEKIEKIREGRSPGSGLAELDEAGDEAEAPEELAPGTPAAALPTPTVLMVGVAVVLVSTLWLLFGGTADSADNDVVVAGQDVAETRLEASGGELNTGGVEPVGAPVSRDGERAPTLDRAATVPESGTASAPTPEDGVSSTSVPSSNRPAPRLQMSHRSRRSVPARRYRPLWRHRRTLLPLRSAANWIRVRLTVSRWPNGSVSMSSAALPRDGCSSTRASGQGRARPSSIDGCGTGSLSSRSLSTSDPTTGQDIEPTVVRPSRQRSAARGGLSFSSVVRTRSTSRSFSCPDPITRPMGMTDQTVLTTGHGTLHVRSCDAETLSDPDVAIPGMKQRRQQIVIDSRWLLGVSNTVFIGSQS